MYIIWTIVFFVILWYLNLICQQFVKQSWNCIYVCTWTGLPNYHYVCYQLPVGRNPNPNAAIFVFKKGVLQLVIVKCKMFSIICGCGYSIWNHLCENRISLLNIEVRHPIKISQLYISDPSFNPCFIYLNTKEKHEDNWSNDARDNLKLRHNKQQKTTSPKEADLLKWN